MKVKFEELLMAYFNKNISQHKVPGGKSTIISAKYYKVKELDDKIVTDREFKTLSLTDKQRVTTRNLNFSTKDKPYSEIVLSEEFLDAIGMTYQEWVTIKNDPTKQEEYKKIFTILAYRIPTQAQHSMMPAIIVDFLPRHYGSTAIPPSQITAISGADYDVDSIFIQRHAVYKKGKDYKSFEKEDISKESLKKSLTKNTYISDLLKQIDNTEKKDLQKEKASYLSQINKLNKEYFQASSKSIKQSILIEKQLLQEELIKVNNLIDELEENNLNLVLSQMGMKEEDFVVLESRYNDLLQQRLDVLTTEEGIELLNSPAEDLFKDIYKNYFANIFPNEDNFIVYSGLDTQLNEYLKVSTGSKAIGGSANMNKVAAFLQKNRVALKEEVLAKLQSIYSLPFDSASPYESDFELYIENNELQVRDLITDKPIPKSNTLSNNVSITVDTAKDQRLIQFFLTDANISYASTLASLGFGVNRLATFLLNPISKDISSKLQLMSKGTAVDLIDEMIEELKKLPIEEINKVPLEDKDLVEGVKNFKQVQKLLSSPKTTYTVEEQKLLNTQLQVALLYKEVAKITEDNYTINTILNFNKEVGERGTAVDKILASIKKTSLDTFSYQGDNIIGNTYIQQVADSLVEIKKNISDNLIAYTHEATKYIDPLLKTTIRMGVDPIDISFQQKLKDSFVEYLGMKVLSTTPNMFPNSGAEYSILDIDIINGTKVMEAYNQAIPYMKAEGMPILNALKVVDATDKYPFARIGSDTFAGLSQSDKQKFIDDFDRLFANPNTRHFGRLLVTHMAAHDNFRFIRNSAISYARPRYFDNLNNIYKEALEPIFQGNNSISQTSELLGKSHNNILRDFGKYFFSDKRNGQNLKTPDNILTYKKDHSGPVDIKKFGNSYAFEYNPEVHSYLPLFFKEQQAPNEYGRAEFVVYHLSNIKDNIAAYTPLQTVNSDYDIGLKLYQLPYDNYINVINEALSKETLPVDPEASQVFEKFLESKNNVLTKLVNNQLNVISNDYGVVQINTNPTLEKTQEFVELIKPQIQAQTYKENKGKNANEMFHYGLMWARINQKASPVKINAFEKAGYYAYHNLDQNGNSLPDLNVLQPIIDELQNNLGLDMSNYDSVIGNIYLDNQYVYPHKDTTESRSARNYPVIVYTIGNDAGLGIVDNNEGKMTFANQYDKQWLPEKDKLKGYTNELLTTNGSIYTFGLGGNGRFELTHSTPMNNKKMKDFPPITLPSGEVITKYTITLTFRRAQDLDNTIPITPAVIENNQSPVLPSINTEVEIKPKEVIEPLFPASVKEVKQVEVKQSTPLKFEYQGKEISTAFTLTEGQDKALKRLVDFANSSQKVITLQGAAGTGKTSVIGYLQKYLKGHTFVYLAPTHAATAELAFATVSAGNKKLPMTVASGFNLRFDPATGKSNANVTKKLQQRLGYSNNVLVIDESSMLANKDLELLLKAIEKDNSIKVIFMGDKLQIPEVDVTNPKVKQVSKVFQNYEQVTLTEVKRTSSDSILNVLTNLRNNPNSRIPKVQNNEEIQYLQEGNFNQELVNTLNEDPEGTILISYTNDGVKGANSKLRRSLGIEGDLNEKDVIIGYLGYSSKQIEKGDLANSIKYSVQNVEINGSEITINATSKKLSSLREQGYSSIPEVHTGKYLQLGNNDSLTFENLTVDDFTKNNQKVSKVLKDLYEMKQAAIKNPKLWVTYYGYQESTASFFALYNLGDTYIYNPATDRMEKYNSALHSKIDSDMKVEKGIDFGYATTIHKSQGSTIPNVFFDTDTLPKGNSSDLYEGQNKISTEKHSLSYVALSRASKKLVVKYNTPSLFYDPNNLNFVEDMRDTVNEIIDPKTLVGADAFSDENNVSLPDDFIEAQSIDPNITATQWNTMSSEDKKKWFECNKKKE
jgi:hypothetical protein